MMLCIYNTINNRITHYDIRMRHIDFCTQYLFPIFILASLHFFEECQVFFYTTITVWTIDTRSREIAAILFNFICSLIIYISLAKGD